jgi:hypothetical protein
MGALFMARRSTSNRDRIKDGAHCQALPLLMNLAIGLPGGATISAW